MLLFGSIPIALYVGYMAYRRTSGAVIRKLVAALSYLLAAFVFSAYSGFILLFRDGFHPDGVQSKGMEGVLQTLPDIGLAALIGGAFAVLGWVVQATRLRRVESR